MWHELSYIYGFLYADEVIVYIDELQKHCFGASRSGAGGAKTKLELIKEPIRQGTTVMIQIQDTGFQMFLAVTAHERFFVPDD